MTGKFLVYGLVDPRTHQLRYVGKSASGLQRPKQHTQPHTLKRKGRTKNLSWLKSLLRNGLKCEIVVLEEVETLDALVEAECFWIGYFKMVGANLNNMTRGGEGWTGGKHSPQTIAARTKCTKEVLARGVALYESGLSLRATCKELRIDARTLRFHMDRAGVVRRPNVSTLVTENMLELLLQKKQPSETLHAAARRLYPTMEPTVFYYHFRRRKVI